MVEIVLKLPISKDKVIEARHNRRTREWLIRQIGEVGVRVLNDYLDEQEGWTYQEKR